MRFLQPAAVVDAVGGADVADSPARRYGSEFGDERGATAAPLVGIAGQVGQLISRR